MRCGPDSVNIISARDLPTLQLETFIGRTAGAVVPRKFSAQLIYFCLGGRFFASHAKVSATKPSSNFVESAILCR